MPQNYITEAAYNELALVNLLIDELTHFGASHFASRTLKLEQGLYVIREQNLFIEADRS